MYAVQKILCVLYYFMLRVA